MIEVVCECDKRRQIPESMVGKRFRCPTCGLTLQLTAAEQLADGCGLGDFDAGFSVVEGPEFVGTRILLGGVAEIQIGKMTDRHIVLPGTLVSRGHCKVVRVDFGPSRWKLVDNRSTNGLFVNDQRITEKDLEDGDVVGIGEYRLQFNHVDQMSGAQPELIPEEEPELGLTPAAGIVHARTNTSRGLTSPAKGGGASAAEVTLANGQLCPSCDNGLPKSAKFCVRCGIDIKTGRPVITRQGIDENSVYESAYQWIRWVSLLVWITPMPIPIRSEAYGTRKPYAIWTIAIVTVLASIIFFIAQNTGPSNSPQAAGTNLMLWSPYAQARHLEVDPEKVHSMAQKMTPDERAEFREQSDPEGKLSDDELVTRVAQTVLAEVMANRGEFHWYQLLTLAFLHDTSSIYNFAMHLAGNMLFLMVFGTRVNSLIGNIAMAIIYPILAVCAAWVHILSMGTGLSGPMLGASGAIMGLAGMYLILFPVHRVVCAMWISIWLRFRRIFGCKIFQMRGFWVLLTYFAYDILMNLISSHFGIGGGVAHWAHIGGFLTGAVLGLGVLVSRQFNTHGGDLLSVTLGKGAWPLIGKPSRWITDNAQQGLPRAVSMTMQT